jgi:hypothetical protein
MRTNGAPVEARAAIDFLRGLSEWDFERAAAASEPLIAAARAGVLWMDPDVLRDGAVTAHLQRGNIAAARAVFVVLAPYSRRAPNDLRTMLVESLMLPSTETVSAGIPR